jgi:hypothetical protein
MLTYIEPKDSSKNDLFIELRDKSIKNIVKHFKQRKFKVDYYIYSNTKTPTKIYVSVAIRKRFSNVKLKYVRILI